MSSSYRLRVNDSLEFNLDPEQISSLDSIETDSNNFHILDHNTSFLAKIARSDFENKTYKVIVNNNKYNINIYSQLDELIKEMGFEIGSSKQINEIKAPMPGLILDINVMVGSEVHENDPLLVLEAMKMENVLTAPRDGVIKSISIDKGDAVDKNQLLIEFE